MSYSDRISGRKDKKLSEKLQTSPDIPKRTFESGITEALNPLFSPVQKSVVEPISTIAPGTSYSQRIGQQIPQRATEIPQDTFKPKEGFKIPQSVGGRSIPSVTSNIKSRLDPVKEQLFRTGLDARNQQEEDSKANMERIQNEIRRITTKRNQTPQEVDRVKQLNQDFANAQATGNTFGRGIIEGTPFGKKALGLGDELFNVDPKRLKETRETEDFKVGKIAGSVGTQLAQYGVVKSALQSLGATSKLANVIGTSKTAQFGATQGIDLLVDAIVQTPREVFEAIENDESITNATKRILTNRGWDALFNLAIGSFTKEGREFGQEAIEKVKGLYKSNPESVINALKNAEPSVAKTIQQELGLADDFTALDSVADSKRVATDIGAENYFKKFEQTPDEITNDFRKWRSDNFGGATGNLSVDDLQATKELYKEATGIDIDALLKDTLDNQAPPKTTYSDRIKAQEQPIEVPRVEPVIGVTKVEPIAEIPKVDAKVEPVKQLDEITKKLKELDAETLAKKEQINKSNFDKEMKSKRLKATAMEQSAKKRELIQGDSFNKVEGGLTSKELTKKIAKESSNYEGKSVLTPFGEGKAIGKSAFGRVGVEFPNGTVKFVDSINVKPKVTVEELIAKSKSVEVETSKSTTPTLPSKKAPKIEPVIPKTTTKVESIKVEPPKVSKPKVVEPSTVTKEVGSPREAQFKTPKVSVSPAKFTDTARESDFTTKELTKKIKDLELATTSNDARTQLAKQIVSEDFEASIRMVKEGDQFGSGIESEIGRDLVGKLQAKGRDAESVEIIEALSKKFRRAGQDVQAAAIWSKNTPEGMQKWATNTLNEAQVKIDPALIKEVGDDMRLISEMTPKELGDAIAKRIGKLGNSKLIQNQILATNSLDELRSLNTAISMNKIFSKIPIVKARKLSSIQAMSHLLNGRTFMRNIFGNTASITGEIISRVPASIADRGISMFTGNRSVIAKMPPWKKSLNNGFREGKKSFFEIAAGVSTGKQSKYDLLFGSAFKSKIGKNLEKTLSVSLQTPDEFFKGFTKADSLYNQVRARLGKDVDSMSFDDIMGKATKEEIEASIKEAEFATFQNDSGLADFMSKTKSHLNRLHIDTNKKLFKETGEFGLGDLVLKYTRVPGNIITRGFEYSPLGYTKAAGAIFDLAETGVNISPQAQRQLAMQIGRATTGTGLIALGMKLNDLGIITGVDDSRDYDVNAFNTAEGLGNYKINTSALARIAKGGAPNIKANDTLKSYNWAAPMTTPIAVGARLAAEKPETTKDALKSLSEATWEEAVDLPTMWVIKKMMFEGMKSESNFVDILSVPAKEALPGFIPSIVRQTAQAIDPVVRETTTGKSKFKDKIQANIPALPGIPKKFTSKGLLPKLDPLGREKKRTNGPLGALLDPATTTTFTPTEFGDKLRKISKFTNETNVFPDRKPPKSFSFEGNVINLTQAEKQKWQEIEGKFVNREYSNYLKNITVNNVDEALTISEVLISIKKFAGKEAKIAILEARD